MLFCISAYSQTSDQLYNESLKSFNDKDFHHALISIEESIKADSNNGKANYLRGLINYNTNRFKQAIPDFDKSIALNLPFDQVHFLRGASKEYVKDFKGALADYEIQVKLFPHEASSYYNRRNARRELNDCRGAIVDFDSAILLNPNFPAYWTVRGGSEIHPATISGGRKRHGQSYSAGFRFCWRVCEPRVEQADEKKLRRGITGSEKMHTVGFFERASAL